MLLIVLSNTGKKGECMKLKNGLFLLVCVMGANFLSAHKIDPLEDFRYPESLFETMHEGIVHVMYTLNNHGHDHHAVQQVFDALHDMQDQCDVAIRYNPHPIKSEEDSQFLSSMIDRLESLVDSYVADQKTSSDIKDACEALRMKIMQ